jgi:hypothetical protein
MMHESNWGNLTKRTFKVELPFLLKVERTWEPDNSERDAAWEMYVELVTRIAVVKLPEESGLLRESLSSLHDLFAVTRGIMRKYGPSVATAKGKGDVSFGLLAVGMLNVVLRPLLTKWHPMLVKYEATRPVKKSVAEHEAQWAEATAFRRELEQTRQKLVQYANALADVCGVQSLIIE